MRLQNPLLFRCIFLAAMSAVTQTQAAPQVSQAIDPIYTLPPISLSPDQIASLQKLGADWPQLGRYRADNAALPAPAAGERRVVFYGDSITDNWGRSVKAPFFRGRPYVNRGISGQTTAQMVVRFRQDVIDLKPAVVLILAGTNDIAGNTGLSSLPMIEDNLESMIELAKLRDIRVVLASVLPVSDYPWRRGLHHAGEVRELNAWIRDYANANNVVYLDYYTAMTNAVGGLDRTISLDGVHPNPAGYAIMAPLAEKAITQALSQPAITELPVIH
jgi:lysophospholipase L1-like esterase